MWQPPKIIPKICLNCSREFLVSKNKENFHPCKYCSLCDALFTDRAELPENKPVALLIDSPGGYAQCTYQLAMFLRHRCGGFTAIVPRYAKSAATLLTLGADTVLMGQDAELGPLDAQILDTEREESVSALDEVQSLERLHAFSLDAIDRTMLLLLPKTGKKVETLLPMILRFVTDMMRPLFEKIDTVHYTQMSRALKVAEEYAIRLLRPYYSLNDANALARHLVENYPEHGFFIGAEEARKIGIKVSSLTPEQQTIVDTLYPHLTKLTAIGRLKEEQKNEL